MVSYTYVVHCLSGYSFVLVSVWLHIHLAFSAIYAPSCIFHMQQTLYGKKKLK